MLLFVITIVIFIGFLVWFKLDEWSFFSMIGGFISGIGALIMVILFIVAGFENISVPPQYLVDKEYIESCYGNNSITDNERVNVNNLILKDNNIIVTCRVLADNAWIGCFFPKRVAELELFKTLKIPTANMKASVQR